MSDCIFCKIVAGEIPAERVYENDQVVAIRDIAPVAPVHVLILPKAHYPNILALDGGEGDAALLAGVQRAVREVARKEGVETSGFRLIINCGEDGGQTVPHLHYHLLGGRTLGARLV
ncbi:MAG: histidine triad nucleotide-binding protein [Clostridiales bacterium]|jgi:histidine triad (HIT) family protein|nr:histidine triad nucleotide-binding protein [Clostridiales bacterium]